MALTQLPDYGSVKPAGAQVGGSYARRPRPACVGRSHGVTLIWPGGDGSPKRKVPVLDDTLINQLQDGPLHRFADHARLTDVIPSSGAGVYTIWDDAGGLVYTG